MCACHEEKASLLCGIRCGSEPGGSVRCYCKRLLHPDRTRSRGKALSCAAPGSRRPPRSAGAHGAGRLPLRWDKCDEHVLDRQRRPFRCESARHVANKCWKGSSSISGFLGLKPSSAKSPTRVERQQHLEERERFAPQSGVVRGHRVGLRRAEGEADHPRRPRPWPPPACPAASSGSGQARGG